MTPASLPSELRAVDARVHRSMLADRLFWKGVPAESPRFAARNADVARLWREGPYQAPLAPTPIAELSLAQLSAEAFWTASDRLRRPVLIRGFGRETAAVRTWSRESLLARLGSREVTVSHRDPELRKVMIDSRSVTLRLRFYEFLDRARTEPLYLTIDTEVLERDPTLMDDLELHRVRAGLLDRRETWDPFIAANLFIGGAIVGSALHCAIGGNFFYNVVGRKRWTLFHPRLAAWLHPVAGRPFQFAYSAFGGKFVGPMAGVEVPDVYRALPHYEVELDPGDVLYNAPWWWHEVENLTDLTVGCAIRHMPRPFSTDPTWANQPAWSMLSVYPSAFLLTTANYLAHRVSRTTRPLRAWASALHHRATADALKPEPPSQDRAS